MADLVARHGDLGELTVARFCAHPSCPVIVPSGRCAQHAHQQDHARGTAQQRGYTSRWARYRQGFLVAHPICGERADGTLDAQHSRCVQQGRTTPAQCVDHTVPVMQGGAFWEPTNHMAACLACNTWKANTLERMTGSTSTRMPVTRREL